jgi:hypothetical protein
MANKWQMMVLGVVLVQGLGAMDSPKLNCSAEALNDVVATTLKQSLEKRKKEPKESFSGFGGKSAISPETEALFKRHPQMRIMPLPLPI